MRELLGLALAIAALTLLASFAPPASRASDRPMKVCQIAKHDGTAFAFVPCADLDNWTRRTVPV